MSSSKETVAQTSGVLYSTGARASPEARVSVQEHRVSSSACPVPINSLTTSASPYFAAVESGVCWFSLR